MENAFHGCEGGLGEVMMSELHRVRDLCQSGGFCHNFVAPVVLQRYTNIPFGCTTEVPIMSFPCLFLCDCVTSEWSDGCSVITERSVKV